MKYESMRLPGGELEFRRVAGSEPVGPTLVFLHHGLGCAGTWRDFPDRLCAATRLPGFVYSRFGYGGSSPVKWPRPLTYIDDEAIEILPMVLQAAAIEDAILIGHSDGASMALIYAGAVKRGVRAIAVEAAHLFVEQSNLDAIRETKSEYVDRDLKPRLAKYHGQNVDSAFFGWSESWLQPGFEKWENNWVSEIECPILSIRGTLDVYGSVAQTERLRTTARSDLTIVQPDCGHFPHQEVPELTLEAMTAFIRKHSGEAS